MSTEFTGATFELFGKLYDFAVTDLECYYQREFDRSKLTWETQAPLESPDELILFLSYRNVPVMSYLLCPSTGVVEFELTHTQRLH